MDFLYILKTADPGSWEIGKSRFKVETYVVFLGFDMWERLITAETLEISCDPYDLRRRYDG